MTRSAAAADEFTGKMLALYRDVLKREEERGSPVQVCRQAVIGHARVRSNAFPLPPPSPPSQPITLGIHRSDYMMHEECAQCLLQQVEFNTISASFACLSSRVTALHRCVHTHTYTYNYSHSGHTHATRTRTLW